MLSEHDVCDNLRTHIGIEACSQLATLHMEFLTEHWRGELHIECLVTDGEVFGVAGDDGAHHVLPTLDEAVLVERSFEPLLAKVLAYEIAYGFRVSAAHIVELKVER
jgi:hypothetical protein